MKGYILFLLFWVLVVFHKFIFQYWYFLIIPFIFIFKNFFINLIYFIKLKYQDYLQALKDKKNGIIVFKPYGLTLFCGRQGAGKTMAIVYMLEEYRRKYPKVKIYTNFGYVNETAPLTSWRELLLYRNGLDGVIFAIDEIQNEYNSIAWQDFPEELLSEITQQRKQRVKILSSSQVFTRVVKQLREQCFEVAESYTLGERWTFCKVFDADDYNSIVDNPNLERKMKLRRKYKFNFIQTDYFRSLFDSYAKIERMKKLNFIERSKR